MSDFVSGLFVLFTYVAIILIVVYLVYLFLPTLLGMLGLHKDFKHKAFNLSNQHALIITTSHNKLGDTGKKTGVFHSEMTIPYYAFLDANMRVDLASIQGGEIPIDKTYFRWPILTKADKRFLKDSTFQKKVKNSLKLSDVDISQYDIIFLAGGWGAAWDLGTSTELGKLVTKANKENKLIGSVCHGGLGLILATTADGEPLVKGRNVTSVTNKQLKELGIANISLQHPESELRKKQANYQCQHKFRDILASLVVVDGNLVTGQNQNSSSEAAEKLMDLLQNKK